MHLASKAPSKHRNTWALALVTGLGLAGLSAFAGAAGTTADSKSDKSHDRTTALSLSTDGPGGFTKPSEERNLSFSLPGKVVEVKVKEGQVVKKGELLAVQEDAVEQKELIKAEIGILSAEIEIDAEKKELAKSKVDLVRKEKLRKTNGVSQADLEEAQLQVDIGGLKVKHAEEAKKEAEALAAAQDEKIKQKRLYSTIDGIVERINTHEGEMSGNNDPKYPGAMYIVQNDPIYVEVDLPNSLAQGLRLQQKLDVRYAADGKWVPAEIVLFPSVADKGSNTQKVRLQMANPDHRPAGLPVEVKVGETVASGDAGAAAR